MKSSVKRICWFSIPALALISIGSGCGKSAQEQAFSTNASSVQAEPEQVQVEIILKDKRAVHNSVEEAPSMPSTTSMNIDTQWGQQGGGAGPGQGRYGAAASGGPGFGPTPLVGLGGPGVGGSLSGAPAEVGGPLGAALGGPGFGGPGGFGGFGGGPGFGGPGLPFGPGPYGVFEPALMPYQPFVVEDVVGDWGDDDDGCEERHDNKRRKGCKKDRGDLKEHKLKATSTGHVLEQ